jgi:hypothetical protein
MEEIVSCLLFRASNIKTTVMRTHQFGRLSKASNTKLPVMRAHRIGIEFRIGTAASSSLYPGSILTLVIKILIMLQTATTYIDQLSILPHLHVNPLKPVLIIHAPHLHVNLF